METSMTSPAPAETPRKCFRGDCKSCSGMDVITGGPCLCPCHPTLVQRLRGFALQSDCLEGAARIESLERQLAEKQAELKATKDRMWENGHALEAERQRAEGLEKAIETAEAAELFMDGVEADLHERGAMTAAQVYMLGRKEAFHEIRENIDAALAAGQEEGSNADSA